MDFYDIYAKLCLENGVTPSYVAHQIGISRGTVSAWKNKGYTPKSDIVTKIAQYFNISADELLNTPVEQTKRPSIETRSRVQKLEKAIKLTENLTDEQLDSLLKVLGIELK